MLKFNVFEDFIYLREKESVKGGGSEGEADSPLSGEPDAGPDFRALRSRPEQKPKPRVGHFTKGVIPAPKIVLILIPPRVHESCFSVLCTLIIIVFHFANVTDEKLHFITFCTT